MRRGEAGKNLHSLTCCASMERLVIHTGDVQIMRLNVYELAPYFVKIHVRRAAAEVYS